jgi:hypothetical protein
MTRSPSTRSRVERHGRRLHGEKSPDKHARPPGAGALVAAVDTEIQVKAVDTIVLCSRLNHRDNGRKRSSGLRQMPQKEDQGSLVALRSTLY